MTIPHSSGNVVCFLSNAEMKREVFSLRLFLSLLLLVAVSVCGFPKMEPFFFENGQKSASFSSRGDILPEFVAGNVRCLLLPLSLSSLIAPLNDRRRPFSLSLRRSGRSTAPSHYSKGTCNTVKEHHICPLLRMAL